MADQVMTRPLTRPLQGGMTPDNAKNMIDLYGGDTPDTQPLSRPLTRPVASPAEAAPLVKPLEAAPKPSMLKAGAAGAYAPFKPIVDKTIDAGKRNLKDAVGQLKGPIDKSNPLAAIGDVGSRIGRAGMDVVNTAFSPVEGIAKANTSAIAKMLPGDQNKLQKVADDTGDLLTQAVLAPTALTKAKGVGEILDNAPKAPPKPAGPIGPQLPAAAPLTRPITPVDTADKLYQLSNDIKASRIEAAQTLQKIDTVPESTWERLYAHQDDPLKHPLSPEDKKLFDDTIVPVEAQRQQLIQDITGAGYPIGDTGGAPRQVKGRGTPMDRLTNTETKSSGAGRSLATSATATRSRSMFAVDTPAGREVVYVSPNNEVFTAGKGKPKQLIGTVDESKPGAQLSTGQQLLNATTKEIEGATDIEYHKNLIGNQYTSLMQLKRAKNNIEFIEALKKDPDFTNIAEPVSRKGLPQEGWRTIHDAPQLKDYRFRPDIAEAIEDYLGDSKNPADLAKGLYNTGRLMKASIFWNPVPHMRNAANFFFVDKGLLGTARDLPNTYKSLPKAFKAATTQNKVYTDYLRSGASLPGADRGAQLFNQELQRVMGIDAKANPGAFREIANTLGYGKVEDMVKGIYSASNKALWSFSDMLSITRMMELEAKGMSRAEAIAETEKIMPNYRVPTRVGGDGQVARAASQALRSPAVSMFGRYQYNRLKAYANLAKDLVGKEKTAADRAKALDRIAMLGFLGAVYYPLLDKAYKWALDNPNAETKRPGLLTIPENAMDVASGKKTPSQGLQSTVSAGLLSTPLELYSGRNLYTGKDIVQRQDVADGNIGRVGYDLGSYIAGKFAPVADMQRMAGGKMDLPEFLGAQVGVQLPTEGEVAAKGKAQKYSRRAQKANAKKNPLPWEDR